ncbi:uncharacterized protein LOC142559216 [Dermacentor variabilis]|uniref:uncharacterized protein LOC142559216 n=1 Tax=Dermacentor variabilis TaxID=34621 RepID=UPI003F5BE4E9
MLTGTWWNLKASTISNHWQKAGLVKAPVQLEDDLEVTDNNPGDLWTEVAELLPIIYSFDDYVESDSEALTAADLITAENFNCVHDISSDDDDPKQDDRVIPVPLLQKFQNKNQCEELKTRNFYTDLILTLLPVMDTNRYLAAHGAIVTTHLLYSQDFDDTTMKLLSTVFTEESFVIRIMKKLFWTLSAAQIVMGACGLLKEALACSGSGPLWSLLITLLSDAFALAELALAAIRPLSHLTLLYFTHVN